MLDPEQKFSSVFDRLSKMHQRGQKRGTMMSQQPTDAFRNAKEYHQIIASGKCLNGNNIIFQHHNDPEITISALKVYLDRKMPNGALPGMQWSP